MSIEELKEFLQEVWMSEEDQSEKMELRVTPHQMLRRVDNGSKIEPIPPTSPTFIKKLHKPFWKNVETVEPDLPETDDDEELWEEFEENLNRVTSSFVKLMKAFLK
jgi:hypothetical protein